MSLLGKRPLWGLIAAAALVLTPLSASAAGPFPDGGADATPFSEMAGQTADVALAQQVVVTPICKGFTATNNYPEPVDLVYGDFGLTQDDPGGVFVEPGQ